ncbi:T9SS type A sorting domain-containing protein [Flavobacterium sp. N1736]|uniref:T9SS type A sorting domain-containing protein n=1 Tax=Flavobacterium sp. N1736 TaxID=2986823 RepID=UPI0022251CA4|nr:T9SS type A sorting domain-containing protein [Flavobacterium sp. N1736]
MIKNYLLLLALCFFSSINAQVITIPDANFKAALIAADPEALNYSALDKDGYGLKVDANDDGEIQQSEGLLIATLYVTGKDILTLDGIQEFKNLKFLDCSQNNITTLDLSALVKLESLFCDFNSLNNLNLENLSQLRDLSCVNNQLTSLDLRSSVNLKFLYCASNNLSNLNISGLSKITQIDYSYNSLSNLDISNLSALDYLGCFSNQIISLNLDNFNKLEVLYCGNNELTDLNLTNLPKLKHLACQSNSLTTLDVTKLPALESISFGNNEFTAIDLKSLSNLNSVSVIGSSLSGIDVSECHSLNYLFVSGNSLLESIFMKNGSLESDIIIEANEKLKYICADEEQILKVKTILEEANQLECNVNSYCSFVPGGESFTIQGSNKYDIDNNGCDAADIPASFFKFKIDDGSKSGTFISDETGNYGINVPAGLYNITPVFENPSYFSVSPAASTIEFATATSPFLQDFCITLNGLHNDLEITFLPIGVARPGFVTKYKIVYKNKGNTTQSGTVNLLFNDSVLKLINANPAVSTQSLNNLSWSFANLKPFEKREIAFSLDVNSTMDTPAVQNGDIIPFTASVSSSQTDETPIDNTFALDQTVVGSYDPNDKTCLEGNVIKPELVGEYVHYMIRFENTGTYFAENIVVKDMIDLSKFDISTLIPISSSHSYTTKISDGNKVEFIFEKINLPFDDANNDGYIAFKIKTLPTLKVGDSFTNEANIYFDYNFPILTNKATSTFNTLGTKDFEFSDYFNVYPNPAKETLNISSKNDLEIQSISIYNMLGQLVIAVPNAKNTTKIEVSKLRTGNYLLHIKTDKGISGTKFIKE